MNIKAINSLLVFLFISSQFDINYIYSAQKQAFKNPINLDKSYLKLIPESNYILGFGDTLQIIVSRDYPELDTTITVDGEGTIYLPKLHRVYVEKLSISELNALLDEAFKEYVKFPRTEVKVIRHRPVQITLNGEVQDPGIFSLKGSLSISEENNSDEDNLRNFYPTLFDAIRQAGGITKFSNMTSINISRRQPISKGGGRLEKKIDFTKILNDGDFSNNLRIYDGDIITIEKQEFPNTELLSKAINSDLNSRFINIFVSGRVKNPGKLEVSRVSTLNDAIAVAGGLQVLRGKIRLIRFTIDGTIDDRMISYSQKARRGSARNPFIKSGDLIFVNNSLLSNSTEIINAFASPLNGIFSIYGLLKVVTD